MTANSQKNAATATIHSLIHQGGGVLLSLALAFAPSVARADEITTNTYYQATAQGSGNPEWTTANWKLDNAGEAVAPTKAENSQFNEYITALGFGSSYLLRSPAGTNGETAEFPGDGLVIGTESKEGSFMLKNAGLSTLVFDHLTLASGAICAGGNGDNPHKIKVDNDILVRSTALRPFYISGAHERNISIEGSLKSENDNAVLTVNRNVFASSSTSDDLNKNFVCTFTGDKSGYTGKWIIDDYNHSGWHLSSAADKYVALSIASADDLGANPAELVADTVTLTNRGALLVTDTTLALGNRGLTIAATGGRLVTSNKDVTLSGTISGDGTLEDYLGNGNRLTLSATVNGAVSINTRSKLFSLADGMTWNSTGSLILQNTPVSGPFAWQKSSIGSGRDFTMGSFSDGTGVKENTKYLVYGAYDFRTKQDTGSDALPAGASVALVGLGANESSSSSYRARVVQKNETFSAGNIYLGAYSSYLFGGKGSNSQSGQTFASGTITVIAPSDKTAWIAGASGRQSTFAGNLAGSGALALNGSQTLTFTGDNSAFTGTLNKYEASTLVVSDPKHFGGNPATMTEQGFIHNGGTLIVTNNSVAVEQPNRGYYVNLDATLDIQEGNTFSWSGPFSFVSDKTLTLKGGGTLVLAGANTTAGTVKVTSGRIVAANPHALANLTASEGASSVVLPSLSVTEAETTTRTFSDKEYVFVPSAYKGTSAAETLAAYKTATGFTIPDNYGLPTRWAVTLTQEDVDDGVMIKASGKIPGLVIILR